MTSLGTVIGAMLAQLGQGRSQADLAIVALAQLYQENPLLKGFPIPRLTIDEAMVDLKLAVAEVPFVKGEITAISREKILSTISDLINKLLEKESYLLDEFSHLKDTWPPAIRITNDKVSNFLPRTGEIQSLWVAIGVTAIIRNELTRSAFYINSKLSTELINLFFDKYIPLLEKNLVPAIQQIVQTQLDAQPIDPNLLNIKVTTSELETVPVEKITTMKFTLREADRDWTQVETPTGELVNKLIPH
jgi:hypothetical protein